MEDESRRPLGLGLPGVEVGVEVMRGLTSLDGDDNLDGPATALLSSCIVGLTSFPSVLISASRSRSKSVA